MKPSEFMSEYLPFAKQNEADTGVPALVTLAQAALESGWGKHAPGNNFFGIKAGKSWKGETQELMTTEVYGDKVVKLKQVFRKYATPAECFKDHGEFLKKRFPKAFLHTDPGDFIYSVQNEHGYKYATDPDYLRKMNGLFNILKQLTY